MGTARKKPQARKKKASGKKTVRATSRPLTEDEKRIVTEMTEIRELLDAFGVRLHGYDPGVTGTFKDGRVPPRLGASGYGYWGEPISFNKATWQWLKPLLEELKAYRERD